MAAVYIHDQRCRVDKAGERLHQISVRREGQLPVRAGDETVAKVIQKHGEDRGGDGRLVGARHCDDTNLVLQARGAVSQDVI